MFAGAGAIANDIERFKITNSTGGNASDLHVTFTGTGGNLSTVVTVNAPGCPAPAIPSNGTITNTMVLNWAQNCVQPGAMVTVRVSTVNGPLAFDSGFWTNLANPGPPGSGPVNAGDIAEVYVFDDQPAPWFSTITVHNSQLGPWDDITDVEFQQWLRDNLEPGGTPNYQDLKFVFQQCYGGGFLDDLMQGLNGEWVGSSATRHDQEAHGTFPGPTKYTKAWTNSNETNLKRRHDEAEANDPSAPGGADYETDPEDPQVTGEGANWQGIQLGGATSKHAILFAGDVETLEIPLWNDIISVRSDLISEGGFQAADIKVYYGDGTKPGGAGGPNPDGAGTKANLLLAIQNVTPLMNTNEQLFIYVTDHGDRHNLIEELEQLIAPFTSLVRSFLVDPPFIIGAARSVSPGPDLSLQTRDVTSPLNSVKLNGRLIGFLTPTGLGNTGRDSFPIFPADLNSSGSNTLVIASNETGNLYVGPISIGTGPVPIQQKSIVPTMSAWGLVTLTVLLLTTSALMIRRRWHQQE